MENLKSIRWKQRFQNLDKAFCQLKTAVQLTEPSELEILGIIQSFEFTFELSWKTIKDFLEAQGVECAYPREVLKQAYHYNIISDGEQWLEMLSKRNLLAHTYDENLAKEAHQLITNEYFGISRLVER